MKITGIELYHVSIPLRETFWPSWLPGYPQTHNRFTLIKIATDAGIDGYSAGVAMGRERQGLGDLLGGYLMGEDPTDIDRIQSLLTQAGYLGWRNFWIEPACWDIIGKKEGKPVYEILGGKPRPIPVYLSTGEIHKPEQRGEELLAMKSHGFKTAKLRVKNAELKEDIRHIEIIRKTVGNDLALAVDANQGWPVSIIDRLPVWDYHRAETFAAACYDNRILWLEEPLDSRNYDGYAKLKDATKINISGAEINYGWDELKVMFAKDCFDIYQPDATFAGGIAQVRKVIEMCHKKKRLFSPHTWTNGIGFYINWNMALVDNYNTLPLEYPLEMPSWVPEFREGIIDPIFPDNDGMLQPFKRPGLGFEIDKRLLRRYGRRFYKLNRFKFIIQVVREKGFKEALRLRRKKKQYS